MLAVSRNIWDKTHHPLTKPYRHSLFLTIRWTGDEMRTAAKSGFDNFVSAHCRLS
jgi:hypothetical protein